ncbi:MAG: alanine--tRNA ligase [candidate division WOR-3 bacterium]|nr:alanine--tRNA ligase [candidate division WOR-3 bacterium]MCX7947066.1 alanine--tRNA ligase [candidate division WOR-3 bacterium]MDW8149893.1 alanine--tRNA ligase [candidate division WOR-3 bacterium]
MKVNEIRKTFLEFFKEKGHLIYPSSSLLPIGDNTLLFTNAGMNQFKVYFLGEAEPPSKRITTCQKCLRAGGKHNDLDNVGYTRRHHTFFEMLGNFSFGDYFKKEAILWAWELLTKVFKIPKEKLYVSVYYLDEESYNIWKDEVKVESERIYKFGEKDNFWEMGDIGPCGPSTEIYYDLGDEKLELWNIVFMEYNRKSDGTLEKLPKKNVDTGMGLERLLSVLEGTNNNYHTSLFVPIINEIENITKVKYSEETGIAHRVIADHIRALVFAISDGIYPSNYSRGYVLRRILRRAYKFAQKLNVNEPILHRLVDVVYEIMKDAYPELSENIKIVKDIIKSEEEKYIQTIGRNIVYLNEVVQKSVEVIEGEDIFRLYDTYGIPIDLIEEYAKERNLKLDLEEYDMILEEKKRGSREKKKSLLIENWDYIDKSYKSTNFVGYDLLSYKTKIAKYKFENEKVYIVLFDSPFYAEGGGQVGDRGYLIFEDGSKVYIEDTKKILNDIVLIARNGVFKNFKDLNVNAIVDKDFRRSNQRAHTATHLLHASLHKIIGEHARQQGSLVENDRLRFDFSHTRALTDEEIKAIENMVNEKIMENIDVVWQYKEYLEAINEGAIAIFEEKYGNIVRVVSIGDFSMELCGGTHVRKTGEIGFFKIIKEEAISSGVRRINALVGKKAIEYIREIELILRKSSFLLKSEIKEIPNKIEKIYENYRILQDKCVSLEDKYANKISQEIEYTEHNGIKIYFRIFHDIDMELLRKIADRLDNKNSIVLLFSKERNKVIAHIRVGRSISNRISSKELIVNILGKGGGSETKAEGGTEDLSILNNLESKVRNKINELLKA